jgi:hypothetical protein
MEIVVMVTIVTTVGVALVAGALYLIDKNADRRDSLANRNLSSEDR